MFDRNTIIGFILIAAIVIGWTFYNAPSKEESQRLQHQRDSLAAVSLLKNSTPAVSANSSKDSVHKAIDTTQRNTAKLNGVFAPATTERLYTLNNGLLKITLSSKGGRVYGVELDSFKTWDKKPLILFDGKNSTFGYTFFSNNRQISTRDVEFVPTDSLALKTGTAREITLRAQAGEGRYFEQKYVMHPNSYMVDYSVNLVKLNTVISGNSPYLNLQWDAHLNKLELNTQNERSYTTVNYKPVNEDPDRLSTRKGDDKSIVGKTQWVAFNQHFFSSTLIYNDGFADANVKVSFSEDSAFLKHESANLNLPFNSSALATYKMQMYYGPNSFYGLKSYGIGLENVIPIDAGWSGFISKPVNKYFLIPLFEALSSFIKNYGLIIFLLTVVIRLILSPLTYRSYVSAAKMKLLAPDIEALKKKYEGDQTKFGQEQMKLYQAAGVNPLGGCLPVLLQLPIFLSMYAFFPASIELRQKSFLWASDLSSYDSILNFGMDIPLGIGNHLSLFTILYTISQVIYSAYNSQFTSGAQAQQMKIMSYIFPLFLFPVFNSLPAALTYYYLVSNLIAFAQQIVIQKFFINHDQLLQKIEANKKKPKKAAGWMARLEAAQKEQQKQIQQRNKR